MAKRTSTKSTSTPSESKPKRTRKPATKKLHPEMEAAEATMPKEVKATVEAVAPATEGKRTIEKNREERNGVKRPSAGGACRAVWDYCDTLHTAEHVPTVGEIKAEAEARGWNSNNASIEYYQWRKFNGIRGRIKTAAQAADHAPEPEA